MLKKVKIAESFGELINTIETYSDNNSIILNDSNILNWFCKDADTKLQITEIINNYSLSNWKSRRLENE
jgi:hypothetical protein